MCGDYGIRLKAGGADVDWTGEDVIRKEDELVRIVWRLPSSSNVSELMGLDNGPSWLLSAVIER